MRITGGQASGRILKVPKGFAVRPTPDLVKQAVFNSLGERVVNARVLELFAGTGALSLESLSRGAALAVCVEKAQRHAQAIRQNLMTASLAPGSLEVRVQDVFAALPQLAASGSKFDVILADPPYGEKNVGHRSRSLAQRLLDDAHVTQVLSPDGVFVLGHTKRDTLEIPSGWHELKILKHGDSIMRILKREPLESPANS
jgi:16S rRNA (guanine966-N2)-methyltransferase